MKPSEDKIDLSSVNKTKKQFKLPKVSNPFKKQIGPKRDDEGKFAPKKQGSQILTGSGGLISNKNLSFKRVLPVALVVALVGGFMVFRSFAAVTQPSEYQYSVKTCKAPVNKNKPNTTCKDKSAEALVYRIQSATLGRQTEFGYKTWVQKLAGDRSTSLKVAQEAESTTEARWGGLSNKDYVEKLIGIATPKQKADWTKQLDDKKISRVQLAENTANLFKTSTIKTLERTYKYNNKQFVEAIFKNLLKRGNNYVAAENDTWIKALNEEKMTRAQVVVAIAKSSEAINKSREDFNKYMLTAPKINIVQTAAVKQKARIRDANTAVSKAKIHYEKGVQHHQKSASSYVSRASEQAKVNAPARSVLTNIANLEKQARSSRSYAQQSAANADSQYKQTEKLLKEARAVTKHSPDIPSTAVELARNKAAMYSGGSKAIIKEIDGYISSIAASYKVAERNYQNEQTRIANANKPQNTGGGSDGGCGSVNSSSSRAAIKAFQSCKGITADGVWGPQTCRAAGRSDCGGGSGGGAPASPCAGMSIAACEGQSVVAKNKVCQGLYGVNWSPSKGACNVPAPTALKPRPGSCAEKSYDTRTTTKYWPNVSGTTVYQLRDRSNQWNGATSKCTYGSWSGWRDVSKSTYNKYN